MSPGNSVSLGGIHQRTNHGRKCQINNRLKQLAGRAAIDSQEL